VDLHQELVTNFIFWLRFLNMTQLIVAEAWHKM